MRLQDFRRQLVENLTAPKVGNQPPPRHQSTQMPLRKVAAFEYRAAPRRRRAGIEGVQFR